VSDRAEFLASACALITAGEIDAAKQSLLNNYPCSPASTTRKPWSLQRLVKVFLRDGFTDRYFGTRLVFPGTLRALSLLLSDAFPYHRNWKQGETHPAFWELYPTIDHVVPLARGGADDESNVVTTSMLRNSAKSNWLCDEIGWPSQLALCAAEWDGLLPWFMSAWEKDALLRQDDALRGWHRAARDVVDIQTR
jgi:5-methylcytosine-specific restriction endonuclease McrA